MSRTVPRDSFMFFWKTWENDAYSEVIALGIRSSFVNTKAYVMQNRWHEFI